MTMRCMRLEASSLILKDLKNANSTRLLNKRTISDVGEATNNRTSSIPILEVVQVLKILGSILETRVEDSKEAINSIIQLPSNLLRIQQKAKFL